MGHFYFLLGLGALALLAFLLSIARRFGPRYRLPYVADGALFSPEQRAFLAVLERAVGRDYRVYGKVRVADVLGVRPRLDRMSRRRARERLGQRRFDFLVCTAESSAIVCAVNLSPPSRLGRRPPRDRLDRICAAACLPFVRFRAGDRYSVVEIEERVFGAMHAVRLRAHDSEPPREETQEALEHLSAVISNDQDTNPSKERSRSGLRAALSRDRRSLPKGNSDGEATSLKADRSEPILAPILSTGAEVDEGPEFRIDGDLDLEERPFRPGR